MTSYNPFDAATKAFAGQPEWMRTNFGKTRETKDMLQNVVIAHLKEAKMAAIKLDMEEVVKTIKRLLNENS